MSSIWHRLEERTFINKTIHPKPKVRASMNIIRWTTVREEPRFISHQFEHAINSAANTRVLTNAHFSSLRMLKPHEQHPVVSTWWTDREVKSFNQQIKVTYISFCFYIQTVLLCHKDLTSTGVGGDFSASLVFREKCSFELSGKFSVSFKERLSGMRLGALLLYSRYVVDELCKYR